ncbi:MAG: hypothetical protein ETSY1_31380 [Candidatus Entotheonella factor]|uniref:Mycothiol-dependent maleylpyruvate isomerase metal-binding domain-containing protein n=1 Tax=Entotheonella factor TaxID=1429438 RepID=W4LB88_ENTF1|nr:maleylpyruvate isomerase family mycothiol-dependent enzyme [Candidatus Entotheonella palauensis]ETW95257.1 MAG: hypothetical protein ETSY1_31380 [Candidatus Entotheonella factor]
MGQEVVDKMEAVWRSIDALCANLTDEQWKTPTDCPNWSVQDQLSHLCAGEHGLLGRPPVEHTPSDLSHVKNEMGERNEANVDYRRSKSGPEVLAEFRELTAERLKVLRALSDEDFAAETMTPIGPGTMQGLIEIRAFDAWTHEQDMRGALKQPGHLEGPVAELSIERCASAIPFVVGRKAQAPDGSTVVFEVTGGAGQTIAVAVEGKRAKVLDAPPAAPTVRLTMDVEMFSRLGCGRWEPEASLQAGKIQIEGDRALGETIVKQMAFMV